jgi:hypothetical protein
MCQLNSTQLNTSIEKTKQVRTTISIIESIQYVTVIIFLQVHEADQARQNNIGLVAIGVGNQVNTAELQGIADRSHDVFQVTDYNSLSTITHNLLQRACQRELSFTT